MTKIFLVAHQTRSEIRGLIAEIVAWSKAGRHEVWMASQDANALGWSDLASDRAAAEADLVLSLGGDGTVLRAVHELDGAAVPVLGVNVGTLGYLTEVEPAQCLATLDRWISGKEGKDFEIDSRMMVRATLTPANGGSQTTWRALNEVVLEKQQSGHTIWLDVDINGFEFAQYSADGVIVASPTGSTAYSMSARGPVVSPRHRALLITPVSPHMLFDRSLVLDPEEKVHIRVVGTRPVDVAIDGRRVASLTQGDTVSFAPDNAQAYFVRVTPPKFHQIVRQKFGLGDE
ncbi:MAG: NAD(+)/NADH kinase [Actinobacteria bacterium]|nr:NAD(+)/NADH kinase [Actinomycetota bacterium]NCZ89884.1 NAD(+)/NADH kinase [Actinomycetota bacterium]